MTAPRPQDATKDVPDVVTSTLFRVLHTNGVLLAATIYLVTTGILALAVVTMTGGHFVYSLDDPYIHLALAERIRGGLYGINAGEYASPSSSILWPLLFVPFVGSGWLSILPLLLNLAFGIGVIGMLTLCVYRIFPNTERLHNARSRLLLVLLIFAFNLPGLTLTGMEHVLQLLLSLCCFYAMHCLLEEQAAPAWTLVAAAALPCVRYEGALLTFAVVLMLLGSGYRRKSALLAACSLTVPIAFSAFLLRLHLPAFPLSVLLKSSASMGSAGAVATGLRTAIDTLRNPERSPELILTVVLACLAWYNRKRRPVFLCALCGLFAAAIQTAIGPNGWFYRYEISALAFTLLLAVAVAVRMANTEGELPSTSQAGFARQPSGALLVAVAGLAAIYMQPLLATPAAALGIYEQQFQIARLTHDFYAGPVAVNDLGLVSFNRSDAQYTFDLYGLGSYESSRIPPKDKSPAWLEAVAKEHRIGLTAIYPEWFSNGVPTTWRPIGKLCSPQASVSSYSSRVMIYDTGLDSPERLETALGRFSKTLPRGTSLELNPPNSYNTCTSN